MSRNQIEASGIPALMNSLIKSAQAGKLRSLRMRDIFCSTTSAFNKILNLLKEASKLEELDISNSSIDKASKQEQLIDMLC